MPGRSSALRLLLLVLIALILVCCTASAVLGFRAGHTAKSSSTLFAGLAFSLLLWSRLPRKQA